MARTTIHLMRHGEVHNPEGILYGRLPGYHLSELGLQMAVQVAAVLSASGHDIAALITSALTGIVSRSLVLVSGLVADQETANAYAAIMAGSTFLTSVLQAAVLPFTAAVTALTYIDLRMRKEGLDVELRQAAGV